MSSSSNRPELEWKECWLVVLKSNGKRRFQLHTQDPRTTRIPSGKRKFEDAEIEYTVKLTPNEIRAGLLTLVKWYLEGIKPGTDLGRQHAEFYGG